MAEQRRRGGFGEFEKRVHEIEEEDAKKERSASGEEGAAKGQAETGREEQQQPKKK